ncbi:hypothetical protein ACRALDRAFT_206979 [Sodiomyces alcalophilus JCM 7366]|uniref:uncharacterized protein n=1 Tax=Sodiomyces alcalophilus JCM 7366 TaxID=591952 RepID=UPI0039B53B8B
MVGEISDQLVFNTSKTIGVLFPELGQPCTSFLYSLIVCVQISVDFQGFFALPRILNPFALLGGRDRIWWSNKRGRDTLIGEPYDATYIIPSISHSPTQSPHEDARISADLGLNSTATVTPSCDRQVLSRHLVSLCCQTETIGTSKRSPFGEEWPPLRESVPKPQSSPTLGHLIPSLSPERTTRFSVPFSPNLVLCLWGSTNMSTPSANLRSARKDIGIIKSMVGTPDHLGYQHLMVPRRTKKYSPQAPKLPLLSPLHVIKTCQGIKP